MDETTPAPTYRNRTRLATGYAMQVQEHDQTIEIYAPDGRMCIHIHLAQGGAHIELQGASLAIRTDHALSIDCERFDLRATHGIALNSGEDLHLIAAGTLSSDAALQHQSARDGDIRLQASEDVQLDGCRILLNSPKPGTTVAP